MSIYQSYLKIINEGIHSHQIDREIFKRDVLKGRKDLDINDGDLGDPDNWDRYVKNGKIKLIKRKYTSYYIFFLENKQDNFSLTLRINFSLLDRSPQYKTICSYIQTTCKSILSLFRNSGIINYLFKALRII